MAVEIYSDGSCYLNDSGRGGYGAIIYKEDSIIEICGGYTHTTNNQMELSAVIFSLKQLDEPCDVTVYSDSRYVTEPVNKQWLNNWIKKDFQGIKNPNLWKQLIPLLELHNVTFIWVKSHGTCQGNNRADELAAIGASLNGLCKIPDTFA